MKITTLCSWVMGAILLMGLSACSASAGDKITPQPTATATPAPTSVPVIFLPTAPPLPAPPVSTPNVTPTATPNTVKIFMIALEDNGKSGVKIGCNDSVVPVDIQIKETDKPVAAALTQLFAIKTKDSNGFYNSLYQSNIRVQTSDVVRGKVVVNLIGTYKLGGTCDTPRFIAQIRNTVEQFDWSKDATITLNGVALERIK
jgi:hypothetical protein